MGKILEAKEKQTTKRNKPLEVLGDNDTYINKKMIKNRIAGIKRKSKREELTALRASLKAQYVKTMGGSPYKKEQQKAKKSETKTQQESYVRLMTPRTKVLNHYYMMQNNRKNLLHKQNKKKHKTLKY